MKNLHAKLKNHGKKVIIHLKRHHRKYLFGALCSGILALVGMHTANTINSTFADEERSTQSIIYDQNANITYVDTEGHEFTGIGTITISNGEDSITILDRNLGATTNDINETGSYGYHFQWGNNYGFEIGCREGGCSDEVTQSVTSGETVDTSGYGPGNYYTGNIFRKTNSPRDWSDPQNDNLWGGSGDGEINDRGYFAENQIDRQGPCPDGYHIPSAGEWGRLLNLWVINYDAELSGNSGILPHYSGNNIGLMFSDTLKIPLAGSRGNAGKVGAPDDAILGSSSPIDRYTVVLNIHPNVVYVRKYLARGIAGSLRCFKNQTTVGSTTCDIEYSTTGLTNQDVVAYLTGCSEEITTEENEYTFTGNGTHTFEFQDLVGNTGEAIATVDRIDKIAPTCDVEYSTTGLTNQDVVAYLTGCNEGITTEETEYTFTGNGTYTFEFQDLAGNTGSIVAEVTWIDKIKPTCDVAYSTTGATTGNVVASLTGCNKTMRGTDLQHTFTGNGTYTFEFQDFLGNTGSTEAEVTWIISGNNTIYFDTEGNEFTWNDLTICDLNNSGECITLMDRNLGATTNDISKTGSYGYHYQWGNNYGFSPFDSIMLTTDKAVRSDEFNNKGSYNTKFIISGDYREDEVIYSGGENIYNYHIGVWGGSDDDNDNNRGASLRNHKDRQGPCPDGYHVPSAGERGLLVKYYRNKYADDIRLYEGDSSSTSIGGDGLYYFSDTDTRLKFQEFFKIPLAGSRYWLNGYLINMGSYGNYRSSSPVYNGGNSLNFTIRDADVGKSNGYWIHMEGESVRCFKNSGDIITGNSLVDYFKIRIPEYITVEETTEFTVKAIKNGETLKSYSGTIFLGLRDEKGKLLSGRSYKIVNDGVYDFKASDQGSKTFKNGLKINNIGTYTLEIEDRSGGYKGSATIIVTGYTKVVVYDTLTFNPHFSNEENEAYQYAHHYGITTKDNIKDADMHSGLNRIAMAKMLSQYAINALGIRDFDTSRNCTFKDVSLSLDKEYDYGVTKACQLGIMGVNMPNNRFYPNGYVSRAEFATALSRLLYNTKDGTDKYYSTHIAKLKKEGVISNTDPALWELRGYVMLMLKRAGEEYND